MSEMDDDVDSDAFGAGDDSVVVRLLVSLVHEPRRVSRQELQAIREWMANLPFNQRILTVPLELQDIRVDLEPLGRRTTSLRIHLAKRVVIDEQWSHETSTIEYIGDLRRAIRDDASRIAVYPRGGRHHRYLRRVRYRRHHS